MCFSRQISRIIMKVPGNTVKNGSLWERYKFIGSQVDDFISSRNFALYERSDQKGEASDGKWVEYNN